MYLYCIISLILRYLIFAKKTIICYYKCNIINIKFMSSNLSEHCGEEDTLWSVDTIEQISDLRTECELNIDVNDYLIKKTINSPDVQYRIEDINWPEVSKRIQRLNTYITAELQEIQSNKILDWRNDLKLKMLSDFKQLCSEISVDDLIAQDQLKVLEFSVINFNESYGSTSKAKIDAIKKFIWLKMSPRDLGVFAGVDSQLLSTFVSEYLRIVWGFSFIRKNMLDVFKSLQKEPFFLPEDYNELRKLLKYLYKKWKSNREIIMMIDGFNYAHDIINEEKENWIVKWKEIISLYSDYEKSTRYDFERLSDQEFIEHVQSNTLWKSALDLEKQSKILNNKDYDLAVKNLVRITEEFEAHYENEISWVDYNIKKTKVSEFLKQNELNDIDISTLLPQTIEDIFAISVLINYVHNEMKINTPTWESKNYEYLVWLPFVDLLTYWTADCNQIATLYLHLSEAVGLKLSSITMPGHAAVFYSSDDLDLSVESTSWKIRQWDFYRKLWITEPRDHAKDPHYIIVTNLLDTLFTYWVNNERKSEIIERVYSFDNSFFLPLLMMYETEYDGWNYEKAKEIIERILKQIPLVISAYIDLWITAFKKDDQKYRELSQNILNNFDTYIAQIITDLDSWKLSQSNFSGEEVDDLIEQYKDLTKL